MKSCIFGLGCRFVKEIRAPEVIIKIINTYITPMQENASIVWSQNRIMYEQKLERVLLIGSKIALKAQYRHHNPLYIYYI